MYKEQEQQKQRHRRSSAAVAASATITAATAALIPAPAAPGAPHQVLVHHQQLHLLLLQLLLRRCSCRERRQLSPWMDSGACLFLLSFHASTAHASQALQTAAAGKQEYMGG